MSQSVNTIAVKPRIWIESDMMGSHHVMVCHNGLEPFAFCSFHYRYGYSSNASVKSNAEKMAISLGATEPINRIVREPELSDIIR